MTADIRSLTSLHDEYLHDESRTNGMAATISFPVSEAEICAILAKLAPHRVPVTIQGGRTGLAAGAVPFEGHIMNLSKMNRYLGMRRDEQGYYYMRVEPGVVLSQFRKDLEDRNVSTAGWDTTSLETWEAYCSDAEQFFPTDPTETSACLGGMAACNASGARSFRYGPMRPWIHAMRVVLSDGDILALERGRTFAQGHKLTLTTLHDRTITVDIPAYQMPHTKNASGYYAAPDMDAIDLFIGSDGTLGVISELEVQLLPAPGTVWGVNCFFRDPHAEAAAVEFTIRTRCELQHVSALEFFDADALDLLRHQKACKKAFAHLPAIDPDASCCVYVELGCDDDEQALATLTQLGTILEACNGSAASTWVARNALDREQQRFFRHAVPESANMLIDDRRARDPRITKLGSDMSVPDDQLSCVMDLYRSTLAASGLESAAWGHIGNNHLHVNILPTTVVEFQKGKALFASWATEISRMGGAVSAEHGVGKLKRDFLPSMYGDEGVRAMARTKLQLDPAGIFGRGNLFATQIMEEVR